MAVRFSLGGSGFLGRAPQPTKTQLDAREAAERARLRRRDARRKIVVGAALLDLAQHDQDAARLLERIVRELKRPHDQALFEERSQDPPAPSWRPRGP